MDYPHPLVMKGLLEKIFSLVRMRAVMKLNWVALQVAFPESHQKLFTTNNVLFTFSEGGSNEARSLRKLVMWSNFSKLVHFHIFLVGHDGIQTHRTLTDSHKHISYVNKLCCKGLWDSQLNYIINICFNFSVECQIILKNERLGL